MKHISLKLEKLEERIAPGAIQCGCPGSGTKAGSKGDGSKGHGSKAAGSKAKGGSKGK